MPEREVDLSNLFRRESGRMTSALTRIFGPHNLQLVEDVVGEALCAALETWKFRGVPDNPAAWLMTVAKRRAIDRIRRDRRSREFASEMAATLSTEWSLVPAVQEAFGEEVIADDQLRLMFACCHARLAQPVRVTLILNLLCGFGVREIAAAFLTSEAAIEKRLSRGKGLLGEARNLQEVTDERVAGGLPAVHRALYLLFNEGYHGAHRSNVVRTELCREAIHLTELLLGAERTAQPPTHALLALMCLCAARLPGRFDEAGALVPLERQDRSRWDRALIERGRRALERSARGELTAYHLEAAIAYEHAVAPSFSATNFQRIVEHYDRLMCVAPSPVVALNRAIAIGESEGPETSLAELAQLEADEHLASYPFYAAAVGEQEHRAGRPDRARSWFQRALELARSEAERRYFLARMMSTGLESGVDAREL